MFAGVLAIGLLGAVLARFRAVWPFSAWLFRRARGGQPTQVA
jgi:hypothetical protein